MSLLPSQKNQLFDKVLEQGFSPSQFELNDTAGDTNITYKGTSYYFNMHTAIQGLVSIRFSPGSDKLREEKHGLRSWSDQSIIFNTWIQLLRKEVSQPDKWANFLKVAQGITWPESDEENSQFIFQEVEQIRGCAEQAKTSLGQLNLSPEQLRAIESKLDYIVERAKTLGRIDWKNLMVGTLITLVVSLALSSETAKTVWQAIGEAFKKIILIALEH